MSFFRPAALARLGRWREMGAGLAVAAAGLWLAARPGPFYTALGLVMAGLGGALAWLALVRLRFAPPGAAAGIVEIDEGQIAYLAPDLANGGGGFAALSEIAEIVLVTGAAGGPAWRLAQPGLPSLTIPAAAEGAAGLFDAFASLPGARPGVFAAALAEHQAGAPARIVWRRHPRPALT